MPNITVCGRCGALYEAGSEEQAHEPMRCCAACVDLGIVPAILDHLAFVDPNDAARLRQRLAELDARDDDTLDDFGEG